MELTQLQQRAVDIQTLYQKHNRQQGRQDWDASAYAQGLVGDVGDLVKLIMAKQNLREAEHLDAKLKHELADCLWSILILAKELDIDLEKAFEETMVALNEKLSPSNSGN